MFPHEYKRALGELHAAKQPQAASQQAAERRSRQAEASTRAGQRLAQGRRRQTMGKVTGFLEYQRLQEASEAVERG